MDTAYPYYTALCLPRNVSEMEAHILVESVFRETTPHQNAFRNIIAEPHVDFEILKVIDVKICEPAEVLPFTALRRFAELNGHAPLALPLTLLLAMIWVLAWRTGYGLHRSFLEMCKRNQEDNVVLSSFRIGCVYLIYHYHHIDLHAAASFNAKFLRLNLRCEGHSNASGGSSCVSHLRSFL